MGGGITFHIFLSSKHAVYLAFILRGENMKRVWREQIKEKLTHSAERQRR